MSIQAVAWVLEEEATTSGTDRLVLIALANHANDRNEAWPAVETIMREAGVRRRQTVKDALGRLVKAKLIKREVNEAPDSRLRADRRPNLYTLVMDGGTQAAPPSTGARDPHERGHASRADGGTDAAATGARETSPEPSGEPSPEPSVEPGELALVGSDAPDDPATRVLRAGERVPGYEFADWYHEYPLHKGRGQAEQAYGRARRKATAAQLLDGARRYAQDPQRDAKFTAHPATWLNGERWLDEPGPQRQGGPAGGGWDHGGTRAVGGEEL